MNQHFAVELPDNCKVTVLFHALEVAVPVRLPSSQDSIPVDHYEVRFPIDSTVRVVHTTGEFAVKIVPEGDEADDCDVGSTTSSEQSSPGP